MDGLKFFLLFLVVIVIAVGGIIVVKGGNTLSLISTANSDSLLDLENDKKINILILGEQPEGGLTDSIMILSYKRSTNEAALVSVPRDLWVDIPDYSGGEKINKAYLLGEEKNPDGGGLELAKKTVNKVTGMKIDLAVKGDTQAVKEVVDILGGIEVEEDNYFSLDFYGEHVTIQPGTNFLSGGETLAYIGSRQIGSDFGRMERQQKVMMAVKDKALSLDLFTRPDKVWSILDSLGTHIETDVPVSQMREVMDVVSGIKVQEVERVVFDKSNYLYSDHTRAGAYILLPKAGDFSEIKERCGNIFKERSVTPSKENTS